MNQKVTATSLPNNSIIKSFINTVDYEDSFAMLLLNKDATIQSVYLNIFNHSPKWVDFLMSLRNKLVGIFGVKTDASKQVNTELKVGIKSGIFNIYAIEKNEIIAGENDKHLNFRVSVLKDNGLLTVTTLVKYNNWFGKLYFFIVKPFHKRIVKAMLKNAIKNNRL